MAISLMKEERDLSFKPAVNASPRRLTQPHIQFYNESGYLKPLDAYTPPEAAKNRAYFDDLLANVLAATAPDLPAGVANIRTGTAASANGLGAILQRLLPHASLPRGFRRNEAKSAIPPDRRPGQSAHWASLHQSPSKMVCERGSSAKRPVP